MSQSPTYEQLAGIDRSAVCGLIHELGTPAWSAAYERQWERPMMTWRSVVDALARLAAGERPSDPQAGPPPWLEALAARQIESMSRSWSFSDTFTPVRALERLGVISPPRDDDYVLAVVGGLVGGQGSRSRADVLRADPEMLELLPRLFEVEGGGEVSLANVDKYSPEEASWKLTFLELVAAGTLSRQEVLGWCLGALQRDFSAYRAGWYSALYRALDPSVDELSEQQGELCVLVRSDVTATVSMAVGYLRKVSAAGRFDDSRVESLSPALLARTKGPALDALRILGEVARRRPDGAGSVAEVATLGLGHTSADVQRAAASLLEQIGAQSAMSPLRDQMAPSVQAEFGGVTSAPSVGDGGITVDPPRRLRYVEAAELVERTAGLLESAEDPIELELVLCGLSQLSDPSRLRPLARRARTVLERGPREGVNRGWLRGHIARLVLAASGETSPPLPAPTPRSAFLLARLACVENVLDGSTAPWEPAATPSLSNGLVLPEDLVDRLGRCADPRVPDLVAALLRLAPGEHDAARRAVTRSDEVGDAVRYALGGPPPKTSRLPGRGARLRQPELWVAAARGRSPRDDDPFLSDSGLSAAGQGPAVRPVLSATGEPYTWNDARGEHAGTMWTYELAIDSPAKQALPLQPALALPDRHRGYLADDLEDWIGWIALTTPLDTETTLTELVWPVLFASQGFSVSHDATRVLSALADHPGLTGALTATTLAVGMSAQRVDQRALAVDAAALMAARGQMPSPLLADGFAIAASFCHASRWASSLGQLASVTRDGYTFDVLQASLPRIDAAARGMHSILEVLLDESARLGRRPDDAKLRDWLGSIRGSGKAPKMARALLTR